MKPVAAMWNKDYRGWSEARRTEFAEVLNRLCALLDANEGGDATLHDDMAVWFGICSSRPTRVLSGRRQG